ncbi:MAG: dipeptidase [Saprospiraceae bacterium]|nr:MAG: dipeptidase [Saprospiraceae bacterium]
MVQKTMDSSKTEMNKDPLYQLADSLAHAYIITDGHVDLPYRLKVINFRFTKEYIGIPVESDKGDFDYVRAKKGGLDAPFMSIYIPASHQTEGGAKELADSLILMVKGIANAYPTKFAIAVSPDQVRQQFKHGLISLPMGMENGAPIVDDLKNVRYFREKGISYITLTHSKDNLICDSSYDTTRTWNGLSPFGREVVLEMNKVGIMVDISHVSDSTFYQVMALSKAPCIASHSSVRKFTPGFERNMNDDMIRLLGEKDGVIHINFGSTFLDGEIQKQSDILRAELGGILEAKGLSYTDSLAQPIIQEFIASHSGLYSDVKKVADHIDHVVKIAGIDHVGLGSDYDGVGDSLPTGLKDVSQYPNLIYELLKRGYSPEDIEKICSKNTFRVWSKVLEVAKNSK